MLLKNVSSGKLEPKKLITHHFMLQDMLEAYEVFGNAGKEKAMKVIIDAEGVSKPKAATSKKRELAEI
jgi:alcohol dehydrogenase